MILYIPLIVLGVIGIANVIGIIFIIKDWRKWNGTINYISIIYYIRFIKDYEKLQQENQNLKERIAYLEKSNDRREDTILELRNQLSFIDEQNKHIAKLEKQNKFLMERENKLQVIEMKQKEFIKYLEDEIHKIEPKGTSINFNCEYDSEDDYINAME